MTQATKVAILNANYIANRLKAAYPLRSSIPRMAGLRMNASSTPAG